LKPRSFEGRNVIISSWLNDIAHPGVAAMSAYDLELLGILIALGLLIFLAFRGFTLLLAATPAAIVAAVFSGQPLLGRTLVHAGQGRYFCSVACSANSWTIAERRFRSPTS
jgi:hypothetical protein